MIFAESASVAPRATRGWLLPRRLRSVEIIVALTPNSDAQQVAGEVALAEGLEVDFVGGFELALLEQRLRGEAREALAHLAREFEVLEHGLVQRRLDQREA